MVVYFDSSVFLSVFTADSTAQQVRLLLADLQKEKVRIYTSIITVQEVSVGCYKNGTVATDNHSQVKKLSRIVGITRDVALTAAKLEAQIIDGYKTKTDKASDNKRRKWDCFHIATAQCMTCTWLYSFDEGMLKRKSALSIKGVSFSVPAPPNRDLLEGL
jgi:predicted nucleic acid-binding protein